MRVCPFQDDRYAKSFCGAYGTESSHWPGMDDVDLANQFFQSAGDYGVMHFRSTNFSHQLIGDSKAPARESRHDLQFSRNFSVQYTGGHNHFRAGTRDSTNLLPSCVANASSPNLVWEAVEHTYRFFLGIHYFSTSFPCGGSVPVQPSQN